MYVYEIDGSISPVAQLSVVMSVYFLQIKIVFLGIACCLYIPLGRVKI